MPPTQLHSYDYTSFQAYQAASFLLNRDEGTDREEQSTRSVVAINSWRVAWGAEADFYIKLGPAIKTRTHKNNNTQ
jgi:hypothetical protein